MSRRIWAGCAFLMLWMMCAVGGVSAQTSDPAAGGQVYVVRAGDNLSRIAQQFNLTTGELMRANGIGDPNLIRVGQRLTIPGTEAPTPTPQPTLNTPDSPTPEPTAIFDTVRAGDTLAGIARRNNTTLQDLVRLNNIANPNIITIGQRLIVREGSIPTTPQPDPNAAPTPDAQVSEAFARGITIFIQDQPPASVIPQVTELPLEWVKIDVAWAAIEPSQGMFDFVVLDDAVNALNAARKRVLLTLTGTPAWARSMTREDGPPDDFATFGTFTSALAAHFNGRVAAYQIWNEPNLRRQWSSEFHAIDPAGYFELLRTAYVAIKSADSAALVVSAGLAPTGYNDGVNALNDRLYLQSLYDLGLAGTADAVAVHAVGFANPPDAECCQRPDGVSTHFENRSFYFKNTLEDYRAIMEANGDTRALWVTKFGWGTSEDAATPGESFVYVTYNSLVEQATYIPGAFSLAKSLGYVGPMFLFNFNGCQFAVERPEECYFSLLGPSGAPRAAFNTFRAMR